MRVRAALLAALLYSIFALPAAAQFTEAQIHEAVRAAGGVEQFVKTIAAEAAGSLPIMTNKNVEMRSVAANGRTLMYMSRLVNVEKSDVYDLEALKNANINYVGCRSPVIGVLINEYNVEVVYMVAAKSTEYLFQYKLDKATCADK